MPRPLAPTVAVALALLALPAGAMASRGDRNHDGLPDRWESRHHLSLKVNQAARDTDRDGLTNRQEFRHGTDPRKADTDRDGLNDGAEVQTGHNPRKRDSNGDGIADGRDNAGTVDSFKGGKLTIKLANGDLLSGAVSSATRISCGANEIENEDVHNHNRGGATARAARNGDDPGGSGSSGNDPARRHDANENEHAAEQDAGAGTCSMTDLTPGTVVHEAKLALASGGATFAEVELVK